MGIASPTSARPALRGAVLAAGLMVGLAACSSPPPMFREPAPRDLLTDLADDGSLADGLSHPDPEVRLLAVRALSSFPAGDSVNAVLSASRTEADPAVLEAMCFALGRWGDSSSWSFLVRMSESRDEGVRAAALTALGKLGTDSLTPHVVQGLDDPASRVRQAAALALHRMDGRRYDHLRQATEAQLKVRDAALARAALKDDDVEVRWRATYTLAGLPNRPGLSTVLGLASRDPASPLSRLFAVRGLGILLDEGVSGGLPEAQRLLQDDEPRVVLEAARIVARHGSLDEGLALADAGSNLMRFVVLDALRHRLVDDERRHVDLAPEQRAELRRRLQVLAAAEISPMVRREALATLAVFGARLPADRRTLVRDLATGRPLDLLGQESGDAAAELTEAGRAALGQLTESADPRDRERAAQLLADGDLQDAALVERLLDDPHPSVVATALGAFGELSAAAVGHMRTRLMQALASDDPAIRGSAAKVTKPLVQAGQAPPWLVEAIAQALDTSARIELEEAREELTAALGLPPLDPVPPAEQPAAPLLDRVLAEHRTAQQDPAPEVLLETTRGDIRLVLDRVTAPRHVESFLELCQRGYYDGLDFHRVVPNFVVQGLDPRHDGWGVAGRRVPDEFTATPYQTGTLGMPHSDSPNTGGCQIFITHLPTPHLDGAYTVFGHVTQGLDVVQALEIGDVVTRARRVSGTDS